MLPTSSSKGLPRIYESNSAYAASSLPFFFLYTLFCQNKGLKNSKTLSLTSNIVDVTADSEGLANREGVHKNNVAFFRANIFFSCFWQVSLIFARITMSLKKKEKNLISLVPAQQLCNRYIVSHSKIGV